MKTYHDALQQVKEWKQQGNKVAFATGVFDILHIDHVRFLQKAQAAADKLIIGVETDKRVEEMKGKHRPVNKQQIRVEQLSALRSVDFAFILPESFSTQQDWEDCMKAINPDIYAVSSHTKWLENKQKICNKFGVQLAVVYQHNPENSTTLIEKKIQGLE